jgi:hypothetical protein
MARFHTADGWAKVEGPARVSRRGVGRESLTRVPRGKAPVGHSGEQGFLFAPATSMRPARRREPPKQTAVFVSAEAIKAVTSGRIDGEHIIAAAVRTLRPGVRNIAVDLGTIRWTDPKTNRRMTFATPAVVRDALLALAGGAAPAPFRFILGRALSAVPPVSLAVPSAPE